MTAGIVSSALAGCGVTGVAPNDLPTYSPTIHDEIDLWNVDLAAARAMTPQGPAFNQSLRTQYFDLADTLGSPLRTPDRRHFFRKAIAAAEGFEVQPDMLAFRDLNETDYEAVAIARARLVAALDAGGRLKAPDTAATAQVSFDCWLMNVARNAVAEAEVCQQQFEAAIAEIEDSLTSNIDNVFLVFFPWDQADLTPVSLTVIEQVANDFAEGEATRLLISGHADRSGSEAYNLTLSEQRARNVGDALIDHGVTEDALTIEWFGESQPAVETADGVREPENRRVEIMFQ